jgi:hypothetical protein
MFKEGKFLHLAFVILLMDMEYKKISKGKVQCENFLSRQATVRKLYGSR